MPALKIVVTTAGRDALRNAQANGTNEITIASIGVTATAVIPTPALAVLPDEIKRLTTISGGSTAADTMHVTIRDDSTDSYSLRAIALYLQDGTLFAVFGQSEALLEKSAQATMLLATDVQFTDIDATQLVFGDTNFQLNQATTEAVGLVELATSAETVTGTDAIRAITPSGLLAALNARLGAGAPTDFVKTLLAKATALAFVTALGIRGAASYDTGAGNGLDADKLDGQDGAYYRAYGNLTGVPATFAPSTHQHSATDITSGTLPVARGGTGAATLTTGSYLLGNGTDAVAAKTPAQVLTDIGAAAKVHSHAQSDINGLVDALAAKAPLASPGLTGTPTAPTAASSTNTTQIATTAFVQTVIANVINGAPGALDTLKELADAMGDDPNFAATIANALATKASISGQTFSGAVGATYFKASTLNTDGQGGYFGWNQNGKGRTELWNHQGAGIGGWRFVNQKDGSTPEEVVSIDADGNIYAKSISGTAGSLTTARNILLTGFATGSASFNGSADANINVTALNVPSALGYWPVQQGTGVGQKSNAIKIGHSDAGPRLTVDVTDFGTFVFDGDFTSSQSVNGWRKLPDGSIEQWGFISAANIGDGSTGTITFPMAFPNACLNVVISDRRDTSASKDVDCYAYVNGTPTNSSFGYYVMAPAGSPNYWQGMFWRATGK